MPPLALFLFLHLPLMSTSSRPLPEYENPTRKSQLITPVPSSEKFLDSESGSNISGLSQLKQYLHQFGYLKNQSSDFTDTFDSEFESAISLYQSNLGLQITGKLDPQTLSQITSPRCGVPDRVTVSRFAYFPGKPRWARPPPITLTYAVSPTEFPDYIPRDELEATVRRAFARWARVIPLRFSPAAEYEAADVKVGFYSGDHGDGCPFDGALGVLGHAFSPQSGRLHMDAAERWALDFGTEESEAAIDLESVAVHEIGHVLGLGHSPLKEAVMYPSLRPRTKKVELTVDDVEGVQALYGSNPNFNLSTLPESETSAAAAASVSGVGVGIVPMVVIVFISFVNFAREYMYM